MKKLKFLGGLVLLSAAGLSMAQQAERAAPPAQFGALVPLMEMQLNELKLLNLRLQQLPPPPRRASGSLQEPDNRKFCYADGAVFSEGATHAKKTCKRNGNSIRVVEEGETILSPLTWQ